jgi:two-component system, chemotaxis family, protein-glutamate methylesterase/glutaminase
MDKYGVLVADDSAVMRKKICEIINENESLYVIGRARNGLDMVQKAIQLKPDLIIVDVEMPELNGIDAMQHIMRHTPTPTIIISNSNQYEQLALQSGAASFITKAELLSDNKDNRSDIQQQFIEVIQVMPTHIEMVLDPIEEEQQIHEEQCIDKRLLIIGSSTGGPSALQKILSDIPKKFPVPIIIIQHIPVGFTEALAKRFNNICALIVKEAEQDEPLKKGTVYIAPAGSHTIIKRIENQYIFSLNETIEQPYLYKPSIDATLLSVGAIAKEHLQAVILTGMGNDGLEGCRFVKKNGGRILAESEETCVVYGMPKVVIEAQLAEKSVPIYQMASSILENYN